MDAPTTKALAPRGKDERWTTITRPTPFTTFWRVFLPWQLYRFVVINLKMLRIISKGHHQRPL